MAKWPGVKLGAWLEEVESHPEAESSPGFSPGPHIPSQGEEAPGTASLQWAKDRNWHSVMGVLPGAGPWAAAWTGAKQTWAPPLPSLPTWC